MATQLKEEEYQYEVPVFEIEEVPAIPKEIIKKFNKGRICLQCSSCHGCK